MRLICSSLLAGVLFGMQSSALAVGPTFPKGAQYAEASIFVLGSDQADSEQESEKAVKDEPQDFEKKLMDRKISSYANINRILFDRSFDFGYSFNYRIVNTLLDKSRSTNNSFYLATGLTRKIGVDISVEQGNLAIYDDESTPVLTIYEAKSSAVGLSLNYMLLPETGSLPEVTLGYSYSYDTFDDATSDSHSISVGTSRTLESASVFTDFSIGTNIYEDGTADYYRSARASYALVINHDLSASIGYSLSKGNGALSNSSASTSLVYRPWKSWVLRFSANQSMSEQK